MSKNYLSEMISDEKQEIINKIDIKITMMSKRNPSSRLDQLIQQFDLSRCHSKNNEGVYLRQILSQLQDKYNIPIQNKQIFYYLTTQEIFVNCGINPIDKQTIIFYEDIKDNKNLHIKIVDLDLSHIDRLMHTQSVVPLDKKQEESEEEQGQSKTNKKIARRTKERRIGLVIKKVIQWRKYYAGTTDDSLQHEKYSLQEAAKKVGISKKSLDDYLFQIKQGNRYNFNFNQHYNQKVGILRDFVRQQKKIHSRTQNKRKKRINQDQ